MNLFNIEKNEIEVNMMSPLTWAYVGDAVYELYIRTHLVNKTNLKPHKLHIEAIKYAVSSGVNGIFTAHGDNIESIKQSPILKELLEC